MTSIEDLMENLLVEIRPIILLIKPHTIKGIKGYNFSEFVQYEASFSKEIKAKSTESSQMSQDFVVRQLESDDLALLRELFGIKKLPCMLVYHLNELHYCKQYI